MKSGIFLGLGSNLGDRAKNLQEAQKLLDLEILRRSSIYETEPVGYLDQPWFYNAVVLIDTNLTAEGLLARCKEVEQALHRQRGIPTGPRTIDLDLLFYHQAILNTPDLAVPHPAIPQRRFVLEPLNEIAPSFMHPLLKQTVAELLRICPDQSIVRKLKVDPDPTP
jgi:2-amino-4-hydroxy-6-hydroxymethyldihydropteridine diphosphokinase